MLKYIIYTLMDIEKGEVIVKEIRPYFMLINVADPTFGSVNKENLIEASRFSFWQLVFLSIVINFRILTSIITC